MTKWDAVGSCDTVARLLAAMLKTCRVARYICSERKIRVSSYLADMYLDQIVDHLWDLWKAASGVSVFIYVYVKQIQMKGLQSS